MEKIGSAGSVPGAVQLNRQAAAKKLEAAKDLPKQLKPGRLPLGDAAPVDSAPAPKVSPPSAPSTPSTPKVEAKNLLDAMDFAPKEIRPREPKAVKAAKDGGEPKAPIRKPALFFVGGLGLLSTTDNSGVKHMAENVRGSRYYGWNQKDEMLDEITRRTPEQPVILVGHSLGGDSVVELANDLNRLEKQFRTVDLLVTMDAFGLGNDVIPPNVKEHLNFFGHNNTFLNDSPHVALNAEETKVTNELRPESHTDMDDSSDVQRKIFKKIQEVLARAATPQKVEQT